jgi:hypothetical protein
MQPQPTAFAVLEVVSAPGAARLRQCARSCRPAPDEGTISRCITKAEEYLVSNGGSLPYIAGHASASTTRLYDRRSDKIALSEIERIVL